jgi:hypothetical protein
MAAFGNSGPKKSVDILFDTCLRWSGSRPMGRFLDAGTGQHSLKWIQKNLETECWTAVTADHKMAAQIKQNIGPMRSKDQILVGNWIDDGFCESVGQYDTILADYLIGAVDGFSPYKQDLILGRLASCLSPNGRLYVIGMNPIPDVDAYPGRLISEVRRARDSCITLAGHRPYREYPVEWIHRSLVASGLQVTQTKQFTILHSEDSTLRQIRVSQSKLPLIPAPLQSGMEIYLKDLTERCKTAVAESNGKIPLSFDYVVEAVSNP